MGTLTHLRAAVSCHNSLYYHPAPTCWTNCTWLSATSRPLNPWSPHCSPFLLALVLTVIITWLYVLRFPSNWNKTTLTIFYNSILKRVFIPKRNKQKNVQFLKISTTQVKNGTQEVQTPFCPFPIPPSLSAREKFIS